MSQFSPVDNKSTLADHINIPGIYPAGRLDYDSEGLLLLTAHGRLQQAISHPDFKLAKTYWVQVEGNISQNAINQLTQGVNLKDGLTRPAQCLAIKEPHHLWPRHPPVRYRAQIPTSWIALTIKEGRNRQVRRMTAAVGFPTLRLIRAQIGPWQLGALQPGEQRLLNLDQQSLEQLLNQNLKSKKPNQRSGKGLKSQVDRPRAPKGLGARPKLRS